MFGSYIQFYLAELRALVALEGMKHEMKWEVIYRFSLGKLLDQICILEPYSSFIYETLEKGNNY